MSKSIHRCCCLRVKVHLCQRRQHQGGSSFLCRPTPPSRPGVLPGAPLCVEPAWPWSSEGVKCLQRRRNISAWRGHEDNGGEGQLGREPGYSGGGQFFPKENLCKLLFVWILLSLSLVKVIVKVKFGLAPLVLYSMQQHVTRAWAPKHVMRVENISREKMRGVCC